MERADYERLRWRCIRRALLELDITLTRFLDAGFADLSEAEQAAFDDALGYALTRTQFGMTLSQMQAIQWMLADSDIELHAGRLMIQQAAWLLAQGNEARRETAICKVFVSEAVNRVIDRAVQICGSLGISGDLPLADFYREARAFRIYDGPSEVHRMVIARGLLRQLSGKKI